MSRPSRPLVAFLGPSLAAAEARRLARCTVLPPARQGDVWRALALRPVAIALVDGVFESQPSVWHHELLAALDAGVAVFGAASMGALRAAELESFGMVGVGQVFRWVREGVVQDDSEVALLHAGSEHGHRGLTLPLVNVRHAAKLARDAGVLNASEARALIESAASIFYQERLWPRVLALARARWRRATPARWSAWAARGVEDLKQRDARDCLLAAAEFVASATPLPPGAPRQPSSLVRRRRLYEGMSMAGGKRAVSSGRVLEQLAQRSDARELADLGLRRLLLAGWARSLGLIADPAQLERAQARWLASVGVSASTRAHFLAASGLDEAQARQFIEELALEALVLEHAPRLLPDGPSREEGLASETRMRGLWARATQRVGQAKQRPGR